MSSQLYAKSVSLTRVWWRGHPSTPDSRGITTVITLKGSTLLWKTSVWEEGICRRFLLLGRSKVSERGNRTETVVSLARFCVRTSEVRSVFYEPATV